MLKFRHSFIMGLSIILVLNALLSSCTITQPSSFITETYELPDFSNLVIHGIGQVNISSGETNSVTIVAEPSIFKKTTYSISGDTLFLDVPNDLLFASFDPHHSIQFYISVKNLKSIQNSGTCSIVGSNLSGKTLQIKHDAVSDLILSNLNYEAVELDASGGGNITITGVIREQTITLDGAINYSSAEVQSRRVDSKLSGKASALVWVTDILNVETTNKSTFQFYGLPRNTYLGLHPETIQALGNK